MKSQPLTRETAIKNHRKMWNWIADETLKQKRIVGKYEYFQFLEIKMNNLDRRPKNLCYCCEFANGLCPRCPIDWGQNDAWCYDISTGLYIKWQKELNYKKAAKIARRIAKLPERK